MQRRNAISIGTWTLWACTSTGAALALEPAPAATDTATTQADTPPARHHGPPPEALKACATASNGDACSFEHGDRTIDGTCRSGPNGDEPLACMPDHPRHPPEQAVSACEGHSAGDSCSFAHGDQTIDGTCRSGPNGDEPLACAPARPEP